MEMDRLSSEIFSILESHFLFGYGDAPKLRILSVDAGGPTDGLLAATSLLRLESSLRSLTGDPAALLPDFFDLAAGSGPGGVLVALLFTRGPGGRAPFSASQAFEFLVRHRRVLQPDRGRRRRKKKKKGAAAGVCGIFQFQRGETPGSRDRALRGALGDATLRDASKPVLIPCYDLATGGPLLFSSSGASAAVEAGGYDFRMADVCAATLGGGEVRSADGGTAVAAAEGAVAAGNPAAAAITHVLNNRVEFPSVAGVEDLLVVSLGNGEPERAGGGGRRGRPAAESPSDLVRIAVEGASDMVDQAVSMAFGDQTATNYIRIQANVRDPGEFQSSSDPGELLAMAEALLAQKSVESVLFRGRRVSGKTNAEKLEWASAELVRVQGGRKKRTLPVAVPIQGSPRSSSCSPLSSSSTSPVVAASPR